MSHRFLGRWSGVGLVVANMIGAGVMLSAGFMAQEMSAGPILLAWVLGLTIALLGARTYGAIAAISGESGGEYRYLSDYLHPVFGYLAGWGSLLMGFSAPIAVDAIAVGAFANTFYAGPDPRILGTAVVIGLTLAHALSLSGSKWTQNVLVLVKIVLVFGFVVLGLVVGRWSWPTWKPPVESTGFPVLAFFMQQFWIAFAFSGWNAAIYVASEFRNPKKDVPFAMLVGTLGVGALYLVVNWIFVANLTPELATAVFSYEETRITLAHAVMGNLIGPIGGQLTSGLILLAFISAMSAMILVGPRVYAAMAKDGYLPKVFAGRDGKPPVGSVLLQGGLAIVMLWTHSILQAVQGAAMVLMLFTGLTALTLFAIRFRRDLPNPPMNVLVTAGLFALIQVGLIGFGVAYSKLLFWELFGFLAFGLVAYGLTELTRHLRRDRDGGQT
ncbi:MAG: APA family basic amino acid/polyamine antiporter [Kiritimatiellia bacterium]|jgi:APA family basic amino acid/polyamine antiporter